MNIFHEKQEGQLCAQHALNALLQGPYFTAVDLAEIGRQLDEVELSAMAEGNVGGLESEEYKRFLSEGSSNYDDSGFFSVQVISNALRVWNLEIEAFGSEHAIEARKDPTQENAFICNLQEHWFTLRRFGGSSKRWYNLNSMYDGPDYVSETYLALLLAQLQNEGYSIFVVRGILPRCEADMYAAMNPIPTPAEIQSAKAKKVAGNITSTNFQVRGKGVGESSASSADDELARAIAMSLGQDASGPSGVNDNEASDETLEQALAQSLAESGSDSKSLQEALAQSLQEDEDREVQAALAASLSESSAKRAGEELTPDEIRRRRLNRFEEKP